MCNWFSPSFLRFKTGTTLFKYETDSWIITWRPVVVIISWWARTTYRCPIQWEPAAASSGIDVTSPAPYAKKQKQKQKRRVCVPHRLYCKCWLLLLIAYIRASSLIHSSGYQAATVLASYRKQINQCWGPWWRLLLTVLSPSCGCHQIASYPFSRIDMDIWIPFGCVRAMSFVVCPSSIECYFTIMSSLLVVALTSSWLSIWFSWWYEGRGLRSKLLVLDWL